MNIRDRFDTVRDTLKQGGADSSEIAMLDRIESIDKDVRHSLEDAINQGQLWGQPLTNALEVLKETKELS